VTLELSNHTIFPQTHFFFLSIFKCGLTVHRILAVLMTIKHNLKEDNIWWYWYTNSKY